MRPMDGAWLTYGSSPHRPRLCFRGLERVGRLMPARAGAQALCYTGWHCQPCRASPASHRPSIVLAFAPRERKLKRARADLRHTSVQPCAHMEPPSSQVKERLPSRQLEAWPARCEHSKGQRLALHTSGCQQGQLSCR